MEAILFILIALCTVTIGYFILEVFYALFCVLVLYPVYKADGGKMKLKRYMECMY